MTDLVFAVRVLLTVVVAIWLVFIVPADMAKAHGRSALGWVLVSVCFSPFGAIILLYLLGDAPEARS